MRRYGPAVLALAATACGKVDLNRAVVARVDTTTTGVVVVENTGVPTWTDESAWRLSESLRLGSASLVGSKAEQFGSVVSVESDSRGRIYILDGQSQSVSVFLHDGTFLHTVGRRGQGPGEFTAAWALSIGSGDTLTVLDDGMMRYSIFSPDGSFVEMHPRAIVGYGAPLQARLASGGYIDWGLGYPDGRSGKRVIFYPVRYGQGFERVDTFPAITYNQDMVSSGRMPLMDYGGFLVITPDAEGNIWFAQSQTYRVCRRTLKADTTVAFTLPVEPVPVREADRERVRDRWSRRPELQAEQLDALPEVKPIIYGILPDNEGHVFIFVDVAEAVTGTAVDVFRDTGVYLGRMSLPVRVALESNRQPIGKISGDHLYLVAKDEVDVPYVYRFEIVKGKSSTEADAAF
jgi:hypothetical protein